MAHGDTSDTPELVSGFKPHLIVTDLPYGIQHRGDLVTMLTAAIPAWSSMLSTGGAMAFAWESARFPRADMVQLVESLAPLMVLNHPPYDALAHRVDRVIKKRDVLVARPVAAARHDSGE
jgi:tRNA G10  N-methylase Trm11